MTNGGGERWSTLLGVDPGNDSGVLPFAHFLGCESQRFGVEDLTIVIELFVFGDPIFERPGDGMIGIGVGDFERFLRAMAGGMETEVLGPLVGAIAEGMHRAVEMHRRDGFVNLEDVLHHL